MKRIALKIIIIVTLLILLIPTPIHYEDGGTVCYQAILYSIKNFHSMKNIGEFDTGIEIKILGITVYETTTFEK